MTRSAPEFSPDTCLRAALRGASCAECALTCPAGAIMPTLTGIDLNADACTACGQCQGACPAQALGAPEHPPVDGPLLVLGCSHAAGPPSIGCAHAPGLETLAGMWLSGVRALAVATADCATCPDKPQTLLSARVRQLNDLLEPRGLAPLTLRRATREERATIGGPSNADRRRLFARGVERQGAALARLLDMAPGPAAWAPHIDAERCSGCNACIRICPTGALSLVKDAEGAPSYTTQASHCTGCALCEDTCDDAAISLHPNAPPAPPVPLRSFVCRMCGVDSFEPAQNEADLCRICRARPHASGLYQVLS